MCADPETRGNLSNRISPDHYLMHRIRLEIVAVTTLSNIGLLASKLGKKTSTNLGAVHTKPYESG